MLGLQLNVGIWVNISDSISSMLACLAALEPHRVGVAVDSVKSLEYPFKLDRKSTKGWNSRQTLVRVVTPNRVNCGLCASRCSCTNKEVCLERPAPIFNNGTTTTVTHAATHKSHCTMKQISNTQLQKTTAQTIPIIHLDKQIMACTSGKPKTALKVQTQNSRVNWSVLSTRLVHAGYDTLHTQAMITICSWAQKNLADLSAISEYSSSYANFFIFLCKLYLCPKPAFFFTEVSITFSCLLQHIIT